MLLLALGQSGPGAAEASDAATTDEQDANQGQASRGKPGRKARRRCRGGQRRRPAARRISRRRACWRARRSSLRKKPVLMLPAVPPPGSGPASPAPPVSPPPVGSAPPSCAAADAIPTAANLAAIRSATLCLINAERTGRGLPPLIDNGHLALAAQRHADDMVAQGYFDHVSLDGRTFDVRIRQAGYPGRPLAENIAWGGGYLGTPRRIVSGWMSSTGHRQNILNAALRDSGVGVSPRIPPGGSGGTYVHTFGAP